MPALNPANVRHLLRRTEFVDRPSRVDELMSAGDIAGAVDNVMAVAANPPSASFAGISVEDNWHRGQRLSEHWIDRMVNAPRPFGERMALFWHGHICSELTKVGPATEMQRQIDLFRRSGLGPSDAQTGNVSELMKTAAIQVAMLKYLDNDQNRASSPNQNFARELMELFLLGVGNYTEADVEAATAAWTGHGRPDWDIDEYVYHPDAHENAPQRFLGRTINDGTGAAAANETIDVILGNGVVPPDADQASNRGAPTRTVAADFLSKKLWQEFGEAASGGVPGDVAGAMRSALVGSGFDIRPWVRALLTHDRFYDASTKNGLVRQPVEYTVALLAASGLSATATDAGGHTLDHAQLGAVEQAGQRLLYPPNVSGWRPNGYWVNASAMSARQSMADSMIWRLRLDTWGGDDGYVDIGTQRITRTEVEGLWRDDTYTEPLPRGELLDRIIDGLQLDPAAETRSRVLDHLAYLDARPADNVGPWQRLDAIFLLLSAPEMHIA